MAVAAAARYRPRGEAVDETCTEGPQNALSLYNCTEVVDVTHCAEVTSMSAAGFQRQGPGLLRPSRHD